MTRKDSRTPQAVAATRAGPAPLAQLPEWDLGDLYRSPDTPELQADLARADVESVAFEARWKGTLDGIARAPGGGERLAESVRAYEALEELLGRLISFAGL